MLKGAKKAIVRAPHRIAGSKSIEDRIILEWTRDFNTAESALDLLISDTKKYKDTWKDICKTQVKIAQQFTTLYEPIEENNIYNATQETPGSQMRAITGYLAVAKELENTIIPMLDEFEGPFIAKCKGAKECIDGVQKALKKREHKKQDFDRFSNNAEKLFRKSDMSEKEQQQLAKMEEELEVATEVFHAQDEKVKSTVPFVLTAMSEFLNPLTAQLYLNQLQVYKVYNQILFKYSQMQGLTGGLTSVAALAKFQDGQPPQEINSYVDIIETWEDRFTTIQPRCEQGLKVLRDGKVVTKPMTKKQGSKKFEQLVHKSADKTNELAHKAVGRSTSPSQIRFSSPQGFFQTEADLLASLNTRVASTSSSSPVTSNHQSPIPSSLPSPSVNTTPGFPYSSAMGSGGATRSSAMSTIGRSPVTGVFNGPPSDTEQLRNRVRASMSTAARTLSPPSSADIYIHEPGDEAGSMLSAESEDARRRSGDFISTKLRQQEQQHLQRLSSSSSSIGGGSYGGGEKGGSSVPRRLPAGPNEHAVALYTFSGAEPGDVAFRVGDRLKVLDHGDETDDQWWLGQTFDGRLGLFPRGYVKVE